jgi:DNA primase
MAGRIRHEDVDTVRERTDIVQVVSQYLQLKKASRDSLTGLCPFHAEKTPSFSVSPSKQAYYCFGCGEGGGVFLFLEKIENLSFSEAVEKLAAEAGITLRHEGQTAAGRRAEGHRPALHKALVEAARLYNRTLVEGREGADARRYLAERGITAESMERFGIGYAPGYPDFLLKRMTSSYAPELLVEAGLAAPDSSGGLRDRFRGRIMFPIQDLAGNAVGFGGRLLPGEHTPANAAKYVNSPDGPVYHKGNLLYNLNRAKGEITKSGRAFLVEGYTDVIALDQAGITSAVATCGTALGEDHIRQLARFTERIVLAFDSDEAGARAAERAFEFHQRYPVQLSVLILPKGQDPADFAIASGGDAFLELAGSAIPLIAYMVERTLQGRDISDAEGRARAIRAGLAIVAQLTDTVARDEYVRMLADKVLLGHMGDPERAVRMELDRLLSAPSASVSQQPQRTHRARTSPDEEVEWEALKLLVQVPEICRPWANNLDLDRFDKPIHRKAFEVISETIREGGAVVSAGALVARGQELRGEQVARILAALAVEAPKSQGDPTRGYAENVFLRLEEFSLKRRADAIRKELERVNPLKAPDEHERMFEQLVELEGARRRLRVAAEAVQVQ